MVKYKLSGKDFIMNKHIFTANLLLFLALGSAKIAFADSTAATLSPPVTSSSHSTTPSISQQITLMLSAIQAIETSTPSSTNIPPQNGNDQTTSLDPNVAWHLAAGQRIMAVAVWLKAHGDSVDATMAANLVLTHTAAAIQKVDGAKSRTVAQIHNTEGLIQETVLGNSSAAVTAYKAAVGADPTDLVSNSHLHALGAQ